MKTVLYAGDSVVTGDDIADAVLRYAAALAGASQAATVDIPVLRPDGKVEHDTLLIGPASQILTQPGPRDVVEIEDPGLVADLDRRTAAVASPVALPLDEDTSGWMDD